MKNKKTKIKKISEIRGVIEGPRTMVTFHPHIVQDLQKEITIRKEQTRRGNEDVKIVTLQRLMEKMGWPECLSKPGFFESL